MGNANASGTEPHSSTHKEFAEPRARPIAAVHYSVWRYDHASPKLPSALQCDGAQRLWRVLLVCGWGYATILYPGGLVDGAGSPERLKKLFLQKTLYVR